MISKYGPWKHHKTNKITEVSTHFPLITLNTNGLNYTIKRHRPVDWIRETYPSFLWLPRDTPHPQKTDRQGKKMEKDISSKWDQEASRH